MKKILLTLLSIFATIFLTAQDAYHTELQSTLQVEYNLPVGDWLFYDNENAIIANANSYGTSSNVQDATDQIFSKKITHIINPAGGNAWDAGWNIGNPNTIQLGDKVLMVFYIRSVGGGGKVNFFVENPITYEKEAFFTLPVTEDWKRYLVPFESSANFDMNGLISGFHLASQSQTIEIGGFTALNYGGSIAFTDLPMEVNNQFYEGWEMDAAWRTDATTRIDQFRKTDLTIEVKKTNGDPVENAMVEVEMLQHEFAFGTAITANRIAGNNTQNAIYENKLINLDGQGHGFNWVVFENDLKWDGWEEEWFVNKTELVNAVEWLRNQDIKIRGHNLVWPGVSFLPNDIANNINDVPFVKNQINEHLEEVLTYSGIAGELEEWDVLNEIVANRDLENSFINSPDYTTGREIYTEIFQKAKDLDPNIGLWLNDYVTLTLNNQAGAQDYDLLKQFTQEILDANVGLTGIGFQGHIGAFPNGIPSVLTTYDDFYNSFGLKAKVTEFDLPSSLISEELAAKYLVDFMTATFSHESMDGFFFWSFWDGATYMNEGSNLFNQDWSQTMVGDAYIDLVFDKWWTDETMITAADGVGTSRIFKGLYEISHTCNGTVITTVLQISEPTDFTITCDNITTDIDDLKEKNTIHIFPNPTQNILNIKRNSSAIARLRLIDLLGNIVLEKTINAKNITLQVEALQGVYFLEIKNEQGYFFDKVIIE